MGRPRGSVSKGVLDRGNNTCRVPEGTTHSACGQRKRDGLGSNDTGEP